MAKQPTKAELAELCAKQAHELSALRIFASLAWKRVVYDVVVRYDMPYGQWTAYIEAPERAHGGVCVISNEQGACIVGPSLVDDVANNFAHSSDPYMREFGREILSKRDNYVSAHYAGNRESES